MEYRYSFWLDSLTPGALARPLLELNATQHPGSFLHTTNVATAINVPRVRTRKPKGMLCSRTYHASLRALLCSSFCPQA